MSKPERQPSAFLDELQSALDCAAAETAARKSSLDQAMQRSADQWEERQAQWHAHAAEMQTDRSRLEHIVAEAGRIAAEAEAGVAETLAALHHWLKAIEAT